MRLSSSLFSLALATAAYASNVLELVPSNFDDVIGKGQPGLVEFFAPWCGHCKNLAPTYEQVADAYAHAKDKVVIAKVDADGEGKPLGQKYGVTGYPTLKWFDADGNATPYEGGRDLDAFTSFITSQTNVKSNIKPPPPPATLILDTHTFDDVNADNDVIIAFTLPRISSRSQSALSPTSTLTLKPTSLALKYGVQSFPTIKFFPKGSTEPEDYEGERTEQAFVDFLNEKCGTQRAVGGMLNEQAGRWPEFDALASKFFVATGDTRDAVLKEATALAGTVGPSAKHYLRVMEKVVNGTEDYVEKESKRLASILKKRTLAPAKLDEIKIKANVLATFTATEEMGEPEEAKVERSTEEL